MKYLGLITAERKYTPHAVYMRELSTFNQNIELAKLLQKSEMRKDIVIELSYKGFG
jgi:hypothetical protein